MLCIADAIDCFAVCMGDRAGEPNGSERHVCASVCVADQNLFRFVLRAWWRHFVPVSSVGRPEGECLRAPPPSDASKVAPNAFVCPQRTASLCQAHL